MKYIPLVVVTNIMGKPMQTAVLDENDELIMVDEKDQVVTEDGTPRTRDAKTADLIKSMCLSRPANIRAASDGHRLLQMLNRVSDVEESEVVDFNWESKDGMSHIGHGFPVKDKLYKWFFGMLGRPMPEVSVPEDKKKETKSAFEAQEVTFAILTWGDNARIIVNQLKDPRDQEDLLVVDLEDEEE